MSDSINKTTSPTTYHIGIKCYIPNNVEGEICSELLQTELFSALCKIAKTIDKYGCLVHDGWKKAKQVLWGKSGVEPLAECLPFFTLMSVSKTLHRYI